MVVVVAIAERHKVAQEVAAEELEGLAQMVGMSLLILLADCQLFKGQRTPQ